VKLAIVVDNAVRFHDDELPESFIAAVKSAHKHANPARQKAKRLGYPYHHIPEFFSTWWRDDDERLCLPRGGIVKLKDAVSSWNTECAPGDEIQLLAADRRTDGNANLSGRIPGHRVQLRSYQQEIVEAIQQRQCGIVRAPTGSGKTTALIGAISAVQLPSCVIVWSVGLLNQWKERLVSELGLSESEIGIIQGQTRRLRKVTLAMLQTLAKVPPHDPLFQAFGFVGADEVQRWAAPTARRALEPFSARYKIGVSAEEKRKDRLETLIYEQFGRVIYDPGAKGRQLMEDAGAVVPVDVIIVPTSFEAPWYQPPGGDYGRLIEEMTQDDRRTEIARRLVERARHEGKQTVALTLRREHAQYLASILGTDALLLGGDEQAFERAKDGLRKGLEKVGVGTVQAFGTGIDIPTLEVGVLATPLLTNLILLNQVVGRFCRPAPGKKRGTLYVLYDEEVFGISQVIECARKFPGRVIVERLGERISVDQYLKERREETRAREERDTGGAFG
jgi:superfamily II DNA or RNA helicase